MSLTLKDKFQGCLVGLAVGDALGMPVEGMSREEIKKRYNFVDKYLAPDPSTRAGKLGLKAGQYTDDTQLALAVAESIVENDTLSYEDAARRYAGLYKSGELRLAGRSTQRACKNLLKGVSWEESGAEDALGCGPAARNIPWTLVSLHNNSQGHTYILDHPYYDTRITNDNDVSVEGVIAVSKFIEAPFDHVSYFKHKNIKDFLLGVAKSCQTEMGDKLRIVHDCLDLDLEEAVERIGNSGLMSETVPAAIYAFALSPDDFQKTVTTAVNLGGDTDSIGAIAGAISGAYNGLNRVSNRFKANLENYQRIVGLSNGIYTIALKGLEETSRSLFQHEPS